MITDQEALWTQFKTDLKHGDYNSIAKYFSTFDTAYQYKIINISLRLNLLKFIKDLYRADSKPFSYVFYRQARTSEAHQTIFILYSNHNQRTDHIQYLLRRNKIDLAYEFIKNHHHEINVIHLLRQSNFWDNKIISFIEPHLNYDYQHAYTIASHACTHRHFYIINKCLSFLKPEEFDRLLNQAVSEQFETAVLALLPKANIFHTIQNRHPLHEAAKIGHVGIFNSIFKLLPLNYSNQKLDPYHELVSNALLEAIKEENFNIIKQYVSFLNIEHLSCAINNSKTDLVNFILSHIDPQKLDENYLFFAAEHGHLQSLDIILNAKKENINILFLNQAKKQACRKGQLDALKKLEQYLPCQNPENLLCASASSGHKHIYDYLTTHYVFSDLDMINAWREAVCNNQDDFANFIFPLVKIKEEDWHDCFDFLMRQTDLNIDFLLYKYQFDCDFLINQIQKYWNPKWKPINRKIDKILNFIPSQHSSFALRVACGLKFKHHIDRLWDHTDIHCNEGEALYWLINGIQDKEILIQYLPRFDLKKYGPFALRLLQKQFEEISSSNAKDYKDKALKQICNIIFPQIDPVAYQSEILTIATLFEQIEWVEHLIPLCDVKARQSLPLQIAVKNKNAELVKLLAPYSDVTTVQPWGLRDILSLEWGGAEIIALLMPGADLSSLKKYHDKQCYKKAIAIMEHTQLNQETVMVKQEPTIHRL